MTKSKESLLQQELDLTNENLQLILDRLRAEWTLGGDLEDYITKGMEQLGNLAESLAGADEIKNDDYARGMAAAYRDAQHRLGYILDKNEIDKDILTNTHEVPSRYLE
jgi:hypothetical protein